MTADPITAFALPRLERVVSGANSVARLGVELDRLNATRVVVVTGRTLAESPELEALKRAIGARCVAHFTGSRQHVPASTVTELTRVIEQQRANGVVSFGGGSPIDTVKAALFTWLRSSKSGDSSDDGPPHIAIPTTLSAGEFTSVAGITDDETRIKRPLFDARIAPRVVIVDPLLTRRTPEWLWIGTGIRSIDHAVETIYSVRQHPAGEAMASRGLALLIEHLPRSIRTEGTEQIEDRLQCQLAAWLAVFGMTNAGFGLSHALGHQIGPRWNVPHGFTSCITLPHAMRFMAERTPERFGPIAAGLGLPYDRRHAGESASACAERVGAFIAQFNVPRQLREAHVPRDEVDAIVDVVRGAMDEAGALSRAVTRDEIAAVLDAAY